MRLAKVKEKLQKHVDDMIDLINGNLLYDGDTCEFSQRVCLLEAVRKVERIVEGIEYKDLRDDSDEPIIERHNYEIHIDGVKITGSNIDAAYDIVERDEKIDDLINWIGEGGSVDTWEMKQDLYYLISCKDEWLLSDLSSNRYLMLTDNREDFIAECKVLKALYKTK